MSWVRSARQNDNYLSVSPPPSMEGVSIAQRRIRRYVHHGPGCHCQISRTLFSFDLPDSIATEELKWTRADIVRENKETTRMDRAYARLYAADRSLDIDSTLAGESDSEEEHVFYSDGGRAKPIRQWGLKDLVATSVFLLVLVLTFGLIINLLYFAGKIAYQKALHFAIDPHLDALRSDFDILTLRISKHWKIISPLLNTFLWWLSILIPCLILLKFEVCISPHSFLNTVLIGFLTATTSSR